jgi:thiol:disulfide interchange protein DsbD
VTPGAAFFAGLLFALTAVLPPPAQSQTPSGRDVVSPSAYVSLDPVARGGSFQLAVVLKIRNGFHINARETSADYLIATDLRADVPAGFKPGQISYPKGELHTFAFSKKPLNVYEDKVILRMALSALPDAPLGAHHIPLKLRYQACSNEVCLPPVTLDLDAAVNVAAAAEASHPVHLELFPSRS